MCDYHYQARVSMCLVYAEVLRDLAHDLVKGQYASSLQSKHLQSAYSQGSACAVCVQRCHVT